MELSNLNIYNCLIIAGIIQGFIFSILVFYNKKYRSTSTLLLGSLVLAYSCGNLQYVIPDVGLMGLIPMYLYVYLPLAALIPVLIYMYVYHFLNPEANIAFHEKILLIPFFAFLLLILIFRVFFIFYGNKDHWFSVYTKLVHFVEIFSVLFAIILVALAIQKVSSFAKNFNNYNPKVIRSSLNWLKYTLIAIFLGSLLWAYLTYLNLFVQGSNVSFYPLWLTIAATIYWLGHIGIYKYGIIEQRKRLRAYQTKNNIEKQKESRNAHVAAFQNLLLNEKHFLDSELTLDKVAKLLQLSSSHLSRTIKNELQTNFVDYVNHLRVKEAKKYLENPEFSNYTITSIGLEAGFNSKSTFFHVFKKQTGKTPMAYKKEGNNL